MNATTYVLAHARTTQLAYSAGYGITLGLSVACIAHLRRHRSSAYAGDVDATRKVLLPAFEPLFWVLCGLTAPFALFLVYLLWRSEAVAPRSRVLPEALLQGRQCIVYVVTIFLHQTNVSARALWRSTLLSLVLAVIPVVVAAVFAHFEPVELPAITSPSCYYSLVVVRVGVMLYYLYLLRWPMSRANPRIIRLFCAYILGFHALVLAVMTLAFHEQVKPTNQTVFVTALYASVTPIWIWRLLKADTQYWRGLASATETPVMDEAVSTKGLHDLLDRHRDCVIDFAHLKLEVKIGVCATAQIYRGALHGRYAVAVKVYAPSEITEATLAVFSHETARCAMFAHPNVVTFYGMCISPPMVCLVTELCECSLEAYLAEPPPTTRAPVLDQLGLMLDAARAVAYLHSFSPPFLHRDIRPFSFLLDDQHVLKLTDFSAARRLAPRGAATPIAHPGDVLMSMQGTVEYMAPEIIGGAKGAAIYCEAADVYSLSMTLWDILHPGRDKYPNGYGNTFRVFEMVLDGHRPSMHHEVHIALQEIITSAWGDEPHFRPSAAAIVRDLEALQVTLLCSVAGDMYRSPRCELLRFHGAPRPKLAVGIPGDALVDGLCELEYARSPQAALRIGHMLMDAGYLHHITHHRGFEGRPDELYMFETAGSPLDCIGEDELSVQGAAPRAPVATTTATCACRSYAQGFGVRRSRRPSTTQQRPTPAPPRPRKSKVPMLPMQDNDRLSTDSIVLALLDDA
ncbi:TKL protein kinase [Saprolegnia diclina VS20]|uniref:TKL protein kinase n=1 Tax=Saprolegnia diclina (strain VS20) TaxID=1156394 RepID=T0Q4Y3_SAPDV|nr:TKL protein kinase [Saprolegnia diclina VS20]EQC32889.1 TKL protein kinase [Saprolegnia diclina VS20]|eukprot:XP_008613575.1 TKL protein kinase [Saprolegnia diclina VS20]